MTEAEAKTKWCPFVRHFDFKQMDTKLFTLGPFNRLAGEPDDGSGGVTVAAPKQCLCVAADCMMWKWQEGYGGTPSTKNDGDCGLKR